MQKKVWIWIIAILIVAAVAFFLWVSGTWGEESPSGVTGQNQMNHSQMDHGQAQTPSDDSLQKYLEEQDVIMATMMEEMGKVEASGNAAIHFLAGMIPHHESAVSMAESYLTYAGEDGLFRQLAQDIITTQKAEIEQMQTMIEDLRTKGEKDEAQEAAYLEAYGKLMHSHDMVHSTAKSVDEAFADGMIMHHQMAVDMAKAILEHTKVEDVKKLAQAIVDTQEQEISEMQSALDRLKAA